MTNSFTHTFALTASQMQNNVCGVKTGSGAAVWASSFFKGPPLLASQTVSSPQKTIACDNPPATSTEEKTDV
ncbi:hypothetical protein ABTO49_21235, partial [Acinetobacter baumannii]